MDLTPEEEEKYQRLYELGYYSTSPSYREAEKYKSKIKILQIDYDADFKTFTQQKDKQKIEKLKKKFKDENLKLTNRLIEHEKVLQEHVKSQMMKDKSSTMHISKMQLFMDTLKELEGEFKKAVLHQTLVRELVDEKRAFSREQANEYIRRMIREASIYESKPGFYNRV